MNNRDINAVRTAQELEKKYDLAKLIGLKKNIEVINNSLIKVNNELNNFISETLSNFQGLSDQIDGKISTWFYSGEPSLSNAPANTWSNEEKSKHLGDLYFDKLTGYTYRFDYMNNTYLWTNIKDIQITSALALASTAQDTADGKRRVFVVTPSPPYDVGDLWLNNKKLYACKTSKSTGSYSASDFEEATDYTSDAALNTFLNGTYATDIASISNQLDQKSETWYQAADPATNWTTTELKSKHVGDLWFDTINNKSKIYKSNYTWGEADGVPDSVYNKIDGKAQIFTNTPVPPYNVGDLWVQGSSGGILKCKIARITGNYTSTDWDDACDYTNDSSLNNFINVTYSAAMSAVNNAIKEKITTWYYSGVPTLNNAPANAWANDEKLAHVGDLYFDQLTGYAYRFDYSNDTYSWINIKDSQIATALATANAAKDTADGKRRIFTTTPFTPYDAGDLWVQGSSGGIKVCVVSRTSGNYVTTDFDDACDYTDDAVADAIIDELVNGTSTTILSGQIITKMAEYTKFADLSNPNSSTTIAGEHIKTGKISSNNFAISNNKVTSGSRLDLNSGKFESKNVTIDSNGLLLENGAKIVGDDGLMNTYIFPSKEGGQCCGVELSTMDDTIGLCKVPITFSIPKGLEVTKAVIHVFHNPIFWDVWGDQFPGYVRNLKAYKVSNMSSREIIGWYGSEYTNINNEIHSNLGVTWYTPSGISKGDAYTPAIPTAQDFSMEEIVSSDFSSELKSNGATVPGIYQIILKTSDAINNNWDETDTCSRTGWIYACLEISGYVKY